MGRKRVIKMCENCKEKPVGFRSTRFCSEECRYDERKNRESKRRLGGRKCEHCGTELTRGQKKKCGNPECKKEMDRLRKRVPVDQWRKPFIEKLERCKVCNDPLGGRQVMFCGKRCINLFNTRERDNNCIEARYGHMWVAISEAIRNRDNHTCQCCGRTDRLKGRKHDVHHVIPKRTFSNPSMANYPENLITLCRICHEKVEHGSIACPHPSTKYTDEIIEVMNQVRAGLEAGK